MEALLAFLALDAFLQILTILIMIAGSVWVWRRV